jgi:hypothetical protein
MIRLHTMATVLQLLELENPRLSTLCREERVSVPSLKLRVQYALTSEDTVARGSRALLPVRGEQATGGVRW